MIQQTMVSDDFSFPTITEPVPRFMDSPSLWNVSYEVFSDDSSYLISPRERQAEEEEEEEEEDGEREDNRRKSYPVGIEDFTMFKSAKDEVINKEAEERMDMLWENFNEELQRISSLDKDRRKGHGEYEEALGVAGDHKAGLYCVKAWKMTKTSSSAIVSPRKPSLLTMVKVVKKILWLHNSHCPKKCNP